MLDRGLYIELKPAPLDEIGSQKVHDFMHSYLVYRDGKGGEFVVRGGPSGFSKQMNPEEVRENLKFGPGGKIEVQAGIPLDKSKDAYKHDETPQDRHATKLDIGDRDPEKVFDQMVRKGQEVNDLNVDYDLNAIKGLDGPDQNSNSLIRELLEDAKIPPESAIPEKIDRARIRGFENNLKTGIEEARREREETRRERERPNPIEGEIGGTEDQKPTPAPQSGTEDKPSDAGGDGPSDDKGGSSDSGGDSSGEGQKQSARLPDPDAAPETKDFTPEQKKLLKDFDKTDGPLDDILAKDPGDWTDGEFVEIKKAMIDLPAGPEQERLDAMATAFLDDKYGTGPAKVDAVGPSVTSKLAA